MSNQDFPKIIKEISLAHLKRIDVALEGNWNSTVSTVWSREKGFLGFSHIVQSDSKYIPSLELYFEDSWIGIHCYKRIDDLNIFDEKFTFKIIEFIENKVG